MLIFARALTCALVLIISDVSCTSVTSPRCEPIRVDLCRGLGYDFTVAPGELQAEADLTLQTFAPLIQYGCSSQLRFFLCSVYVPMCTDKVSNPIGPCRGLCETVRARCYPVLQGFGFPWPSTLECSAFPVDNNHEHMCMQGPGGEVVPLPIEDEVSTINDVAIGLNKDLDRSVNTWDDADRRLADVWLRTWAGACFVSSLVALFSFLVEPSKIRYPARPLAALAACYALSAAALLARSMAPGPTPGLSDPSCAIVFLLIYYFGTASWIWWTALCACWMLRAARVPHEHVRARAALLHALGWGIPAALTVAALVRRDVEADELTGICTVNKQDATSLALLVIAPRCVCLAISIACLAVGCALLRRISATYTAPPIQPITSVTMPIPQRRPVRRDPNMLKLGVFASVYAIPLGYIAGYDARSLWNQKSTSLWLCLLYTFMYLVVGVTAVAWVWSPRTLRAWRRVLRRALGPAAYRQPPLKCMVPPPPPPSSLRGIVPTRRGETPL